MQAPPSLDSSSTTPRQRLAARLLARPWRLLALFAGIVLPLGLAATLADDILDKETLRFDVPILLWLHARANPVWDRVFVVITEAGGFPGTAIIGTLGALRLWRQGRIRAGWFWGLSIGGAGLLNMVVKLFFRRERPALWQSISPEHDYSFPSGHSMLSASVALAILLLLWPTKWRIPALVFAIAWPICVGVSRLYIGVHFPSDVLAGWCAGLAWTMGVYVILRGERDRFFKDIAQSQAQAGAPVTSASQSQQVLAQPTSAAAPAAASMERLGAEKPADEKLLEVARKQNKQADQQD